MSIGSAGTRWTSAAFVVTLAFAATGCAHLPWNRPVEPRTQGVPIEKRPTPAATESTQTAVVTPPPTTPAPSRTPSRQTNNHGTRTPADSGDSRIPVPAPSVEPVMTPAERRAVMIRIAADTTAAGESVRKCGSRKLLPDQESAYDAATSLLQQTRSALARDELWRAESLARKARQLAAALSCP